MAKQRHTYLIKSDKGSITRAPFVYTFNRTKVELHLSTRGFVLKYERPAYTKDLVNDDLFRDAIKKAELLSLLKYGKRTDYKEITAVIDDKTFCVFRKAYESDHLLYTMTSEKLVSPMTAGWSEKKVIQYLLNTTKSSYDRKHTALFALLMAKSQIYESEKFIYLWMAMNALYGYLVEIRWAGESRVREYMQIELLAAFYGLNYHKVNNVNKDKARGAVVGLIESIETEQTPNMIEAIKANRWEGAFLTEAKKSADMIAADGEMDPYAFFLLWLPYQLRCNYFHGEKPLPVMSFANERPLPALRFVNIMLQEFLDNELYKWFDDDMSRREMIPKLMSIKVEK